MKVEFGHEILKLGLGLCGLGDGPIEVKLMQLTSINKGFWGEI